MSHPTSTAAALAKGSIGTAGLAYSVISAVAPLTVTAGLITTAYAVTGQTSIPAAFLIVALVMAVFMSGFAAMARRIHNAGPIYAYVARGIGKPVAGGTAFMAWVAYNFLQVTLYGMFGVTVSQYLADKAGITLDWWLLALAGWLIAGTLGISKITISGVILAVLVTAELIVLWVLTITGLTHPADGLGLSTLSPGALLSGGVFAAFVIGVLGFVGIEQAAVYSEEARDPQRTVPRASYIAITVIACSYVLASLAMVASAGVTHVVAVAKEAGPGLLFGMAPNTFLGEVASVLFMTSLLAAMIVFHNAVGRYAFSLGREGVFPSAFGRIGVRSNAPWVASLVQSALGLAVIVVSVIMHWDPVNDLFFKGGTTGGFGVLVLMALASAAVIGFFWRNRDQQENLWRRLIAPLIAFVALTVMAIGAVATYSTLIGTEPGAAENWILPGVFAVAFVVGLVWTLTIKATRPQTYAAIGYGHEASQVIASGEAVIPRQSVSAHQASTDKVDA